MATIDDVRKLCTRFSNWGKFGSDDQLGTLNHVTGDDIAAAAALVRSGHVVSMSLPIDGSGPESSSPGRFRPIHLMSQDGGDIAAGTSVRDFHAGKDQYLRATDDVLILPLQSGTQWDALSHIFFENQMYNGGCPEQVTSSGAMRNDVAVAKDRMVGRGVLLDVAAAKGVDWLEPGYAITADDLEDCEKAQGLSVRRGDFVFVRTGQIAQVRDRGAWLDYSGGTAAGLGLQAVPWVAVRQIAGLATDTWGMEVQPNETPDVLQPLHIILLVHLGLWIGEMFDLEASAAHCRHEKRHEFLFVGPPLMIPKAVGSPLNPLAIF